MRHIPTLGAAVLVLQVATTLLTPGAEAVAKRRLPPTTSSRLHVGGSTDNHGYSDPLMRGKGIGPRDVDQGFEDEGELRDFLKELERGGGRGKSGVEDEDSRDESTADEESGESEESSEERSQESDSNESR